VKSRCACIPFQVYSWLTSGLIRKPAQKLEAEKDAESETHNA